MYSTFKIATRFALAAALTIAVMSASAQSIRLGTAGSNVAQATPPALNCLASPSTAQNLYLDFGGTNIINSTINWNAVGGTITGISPDRRSATFTSTTMAKSRVTVTYVREAGTVTVIPGACSGGGDAICGSAPVFGSQTADFYKTFSTAVSDIDGPICIGQNNGTVVFSAKNTPLSTLAIINQGIGIDKYQWTLNAGGGGTGAQDAGDGATFTVTAPTGGFTGSFSVTLKRGECNFPGSGATLPVTVAPDLSSSLPGAPIQGFPSCLAIGTTANQSFTLARATNVGYTVSTTIGTLSSTTSGVIGNNTTTLTFPNTLTAGTSTIVIAGITATNTGAVTIQGVGTVSACFGDQTTVRRINRTLSSTTSNAISPLCFLASTAGQTITLSNPPAGQINWTVPTGWTITAGQGTSSITVTTTAAGGNVTVGQVGCTGITQAVSISTQQGCTYTISRVPSTTRSFQVTSPGGSTCTPDAGDPLTPNVLYSWTAANGTRTAVSDGPVVTFLGAAVPSGTVTVRIVNPEGCLDAFATMSVARPASGGGDNPKSSLLEQKMSTYPNPVGDVLHIVLPLEGGTARLNLMDAIGRTVREMTTNRASTPLEVRNLPAGIYSLRAVMPDGNVLTSKVQVGQ